MDFGSAITEVITETGVRGKRRLIAKCLNDAISALSRQYGFSGDRRQATYQVPASATSEHIHLIPLSLMPRMRYIEAIRGASDPQPLQSINPKDAVVCGKAKAGTYYRSASGLHASLYNPTSAIFISYLESPEVLEDDADTCWHLQLAPYPIINRAIAYVFRSTGDTAEYDRLLPMSRLEYEELKRDLEA